MTPTQRAAIQTALDALEIGDGFNPGLARITLRAALEEPVVEPVAYRSLLASGSYTYCNTDVFFDNAEPLYTSPPPPAEAPLLTDGNISWLWSEAHNDTTDRMPFQVFARAIEALVRQQAGLK